MKKLLCILFLAVTCFPDAFSQDGLLVGYNTKQAIDFFRTNKSGNELIDASHAAEKIQGSPYLNDEFIEGNVYTTSKTRFVNVPLRYNIYNDQVEFRNADDQVLAIAAPDVIEQVEFGEFQMEYIPFLDRKKISKGYFVVLEKGDASLYFRPNVILEQAKQAAAYQDAQPPRFIRRSDEYYIKIGKDAAKPASKKKDLLNIFTDTGKDVSTFIKNNKIKPGNKESLTELVIHYNAL
ncbi:MAG: hypothetical protein ACOC10_01540 [Bacteroidota bacterium]